MIDFNFQDGLVTNTFAYNNQYYFTTNHDSGIALLNPKLIPMVKLPGTGISKFPHHILQYNNQQQFNSRVLNRDKVAEIFNSAHWPMVLKIAEQFYYVGKGFIALKNVGVGEMTLILVACVPEINYTANVASDITLLINPVYKDQVPTIKWIVQQCIATAEGDMIVTKEINKHLSGKIRLPRFANIRAKKEFTESFIERCIAAA